MVEGVGVEVHIRETEKSPGFGQYPHKKEEKGQVILF